MIRQSSPRSLPASCRNISNVSSSSFYNWGCGRDWISMETTSCRLQRPAMATKGSSLESYGCLVGALYPWYLGDDHKSEDLHHISTIQASTRRDCHPRCFWVHNDFWDKLVTSWWCLLWIGGQDGERAISIAEPQTRSDASFPSDPESRTWPKLPSSLPFFANGWKVFQFAGSQVLQVESSF